MIFDAHLDLAMNALEWNRDLTRPILELRASEQGKTDKVDRGNGTVCFPEMRRGEVRLCVATQIARIEHNAFSPVQGWRSAPQAWAQTQGQLAWYRAMEEAGELCQINDRATLEAHLRNCQNPDCSGDVPIGYILSLEGADSLITLEHLERSYANGLRAIGPAHYGPGVYANGTNATGGFNARGRDLLKEMDHLGLILDVSHLSDECFWEALDLFQGPIWASHQNCRALVPHQRQFSDAQITALVKRGSVLGVALDGWMLVPNWIRGQTTPQSADLTLRQVVDQIEHVCQLAGDARHIGIGSDLDGAFGREQAPADLDTIADLARIPQLLAGRGFDSQDVKAVACGNFIDFLRHAWD